jgi:pimeloyl-ACP methyl ester carboxylesterase
MDSVAYRRVDVDGLEVFYREAGRADAPALLLLHGFPSASHMFRELMPLLADRLRLIAPDLPGFGQSAMPAVSTFEYTFSNLARFMTRFTELLRLGSFGIYIFDYGAPVGLRMALSHPERISFIISQNGNAYEEGLSSGWDSMREYWKHPTSEYRESLRAAFTPAATLYQYTQGVADATRVSPDGYTLDDFYLARPGAHDVRRGNSFEINGRGDPICAVPAVPIRNTPEFASPPLARKSAHNCASSEYFAAR